MSLKELVKWQTVSGEATTAHGYVVTPQIQSLQVILPFGGFVWSRPVAVLVRKDDLEQRIPIVDATRVAQVIIFVLAVLMALRLRKTNDVDY